MFSWDLNKFFTVKKVSFAVGYGMTENTGHVNKALTGHTFFSFKLYFIL